MAKTSELCSAPTFYIDSLPPPVSCRFVFGVVTISGYLSSIHPSIRTHNTIEKVLAVAGARSLVCPMSSHLIFEALSLYLQLECDRMLTLSQG